MKKEWFSTRNILIFVIVTQLIYSLFGFGMDNSDGGKWKRSGMKLHTDHLTGVQYFSKFGSLVVRVDSLGNPVIAEEYK